MDEARSVESMTNITLEESINIFSMQLDKALKDFDTFLESSFNFFTFSHSKIMRSLNWPRWLPRIHDEIWSWSVPDEHVFLWNMVFQLYKKKSLRREFIKCSIMRLFFWDEIVGLWRLESNNTLLLDHAGFHKRFHWLKRHNPKVLHLSVTYLLSIASAE